MKRLVCEMCGSTDLIKENGVFVCQSCGCKYSVEEARKMMVEGTVEVQGTVKVDNSHLINNYIEMAKNALKSSNNEEAENYANKIIEIDPKNSSAWEIKGEAAGWQSKAMNNRMGESVVAWLNAIEYANEEDLHDLRERIANKYTGLFLAMVNLRTGNFANIQSEDNLNDTLNDIREGIRMMNELSCKGGVSFNRAYTLDSIAKKMNGSAVAGYKDAKSDFGPEHISMSKWQWDRFTDRCDCCLTMLNAAYNYAKDSETVTNICENYEVIGEDARDSCSWKFNVDSWNYDHYEKEYSFTSEAKRGRTDNIYDMLKKKRAFLDKARVKSNYSSVLLKQKKELARKLYWEEHAEEKEWLLDEKKGYSSKNAILNREMENVPSLMEKNEILRKIAALDKEKNSLGLFKSKEKKAIQVEIDEKKADLANVERKIAVEKNKIKEEIAENNRQISEIDKELNMERTPSASVEEVEFIENAIENGRFTFDEEAIEKLLEKHLPEPYRIGEHLTPLFSIFEGRLAVRIPIYSSELVTKDDEDGSTGLNVEMEIGEDAKVSAIYVSFGGDIMDKNTYMAGIEVASILLMALNNKLTKEQAVNIACDILYDDSYSLKGCGPVRVEFANHVNNLVGTINVYFNGILIRPRDDEYDDYADEEEFDSEEFDEDELDEDEFDEEEFDADEDDSCGEADTEHCPHCKNFLDEDAKANLLSDYLEGGEITCPFCGKALDENYF